MNAFWEWISSFISMRDMWIFNYGSRSQSFSSYICFLWFWKVIPKSIENHRLYSSYYLEIFMKIQSEFSSRIISKVRRNEIKATIMNCFSWLWLIVDIPIFWSTDVSFLLIWYILKLKAFYLLIHFSTSKTQSIKQVIVFLSRRL